MKEKLNLRLLSNIVIVYMLCAFTWWSALLYIKNRDAFEAKSNYMKLVMVAAGDVSNDSDFRRKEDYLSLEKKYKRQEMMILGEGTLFVSSLIFGIFLINRSHKTQVQAEQQTRNFLLSITHELKTPLASIKLALETMLRRDLPKDSRDVLSRSAVKETDRLTDLVNDLLLAAKVETQFQPHLEQVDIQELIRDVVHEFEDRHEGVKVDLTCPDTPIFIHADKNTLESAFENILENGLKYSFNHVKINVMLAEKDQKIFLTFADEGIGIKDVDKKKVFEKFYRVGSEDTRRAKGTGLGLYIVHEIIKIHNGKITIADNQPQGTVFKVMLPK
jgi:signal transduction histidine kinase